MAIATLKYDLSDPADREAFGVAYEGERYRNLLYTLARDLRNKLKYHDLNEEVQKELEEIQAILFDGLQEEGITTWEG